MQFSKFNWIDLMFSGFNLASRRMVVSREDKKQHMRASSGLLDHYSELVTWMAALKF